MKLYKLYVVLLGLGLCFITYQSAQAAIPYLLSQSKQDKSVLEKIQPHKALYDIALVSSRSGSQIIDVKGQMFYEWSASCEGWITNHRFNLQYTYADIGTVEIKSDYSTFESFDGKGFDFSTRRLKDGEVIEEYRGHADSRTGMVNYSVPEGLSFKLPKNTIFPISHTLSMLGNLKANKRFYNAKVFDGSDDVGPYEINAFFGKASTLPVPEHKNIEKDLISKTSYASRLAFFPMATQEQQPEYEMSFALQTNGIIPNMLVEYPDFQVKQSLSSLEALPWPSACEDNK
ncbi:MAG: hypothetical protein CMH30_05460 [Micavibrio sp.]|nr:hypothetical protein [Micavibrio sp.]|tara:strand:- start:1455 stop:2318 length:864 start_codon:yes stop_codon:yes gene_type:complete